MTMNWKKIIIKVIWYGLIFSVVHGQENTIIFYETAKPNYLDPVYGGQTVLGQRVVSLLFTPIYGRDFSMNVVPYLAIDDPTISGNKVTFHIKPDLLWHDQEPLTARDVVKSFNILKLENEYVGYEILQAFSNFSNMNDTEVTADLQEDELFESYLLMFPLLPAHHFPTGTVIPNSPYTSDKPIGNGPFEVMENKIDHITFERFNPFRKVTEEKHTNIDEIVLKVQRVRAMWATDMKAGRVHLLPEVPTTQITDLQGLEGVALQEYPNFSVEMIGFNFKNPLLKERFIRKAFYYAYDREKAIKAQLEGHGYLITGPYPAGSYYYWAEYPKYSFSPEKADSILNERCERGKDGIRIFQGKRLSFRIMGLINNNKFEEQIGSFKKQMRSVGIEIQAPQYYEPNNFAQQLKNRDFDLVWITWTFDESLDISGVYQSKGLVNYFGYNNPRADALFEDLAKSTDPIIRKRIGYNIHKELNNNPPGLFLWTEHRYSAYNKKITHFRIHPINFFYQIHEWELK